MNPRLTQLNAATEEFTTDNKPTSKRQEVEHVFVTCQDSDSSSPCSASKRSSACGVLLYFWAVESNPWIPYIGDCKALDNFLSSKEGLGWLVPKFFNALLRGVGQVVFANNPITGMVILLSLVYSNPMVGFASFLAASIALLVSILFRQEPAQINAGLTTYNAVLVGSVTASLWTPLYAEDVRLKIWAFIILGSVLSVFVTTALANMFSSFKLPLPCLTLPFNVVTLLLFTCLMPSPHFVYLGNNGTETEQRNVTGVAMQLVQHLPEPYLNNTLSEQTHRHIRETEEKDEPSFDIDPPVVAGDGTNNSGSAADAVEKMYVRDNQVLHWGSILTGILLSMGQVYGVNNLVASILMYMATIIYSPTIFMMSIGGATLGTISGLMFADAPYDPIYNGIWGFNGILSAISVGGLFFVLTFHSFFAALANVLLTVLIQQALAVAFAPIKLPFFTLPFVLSTLLFLSMSSTGKSLPRVTNITFPEMHRYEFLENRRINRPEVPKARDTTDEIAEEKELVLKEVKVIMEETPIDQTTETEKQTNGQAEQ